MNNIWEIVTLTDLIKKLKETDGFSIIAITLESTPLSIIKVIKKFLKTYSKTYPNLTFLYYQANIKDLGRTTLLNTNRDEYPFVYHIYNHMEDIFVTVNRANNNTIYEAFNAVEDYYKKDLQDYIEKKEKPADSEVHLTKTRVLKRWPKQYIRQLERIMDAIIKTSKTTFDKERMIADILDNLQVNFELTPRQIKQAYDFHRNQRRLQKELDKTK